MLADIVDRKWQFDESRYPGISELSESERRMFEIKHITAHMVAAVAKATKVGEKYDHGNPIDEELLHDAVGDAFITVLQLAGRAGMDDEDLATFIADWNPNK